MLRKYETDPSNVMCYQPPIYKKIWLMWSDRCESLIRRNKFGQITDSLSQDLWQYHDLKEATWKREGCSDQSSIREEDVGTSNIYHY